MTESAPSIVDRLVLELGGGNATRLAQVLGVSRQNVHHWRRRGEIPVEFAVAIETATEGMFSVEEMSPKASQTIRATMQSLADADKSAAA